VKLSPPKEVTFGISLIVAAIAFLIAQGVITNPLNNFGVVWIALVAYVILALGCLLRGL